jgi:hypothetical protein
VPHGPSYRLWGGAAEEGRKGLAIQPRGNSRPNVTRDGGRGRVGVRGQGPGAKVLVRKMVRERVGRDLQSIEWGRRCTVLRKVGVDQ